ncbi:MAG: FecR domain-containing protein [Rhodocyclaceae bacterium]|nr:FecR domain-containing protein [Rhodocyclaceae bacterium]HMV55333.1 FecR family protein [Rhodocyclaceae bacterium]
MFLRLQQKTFLVAVLAVFLGLGAPHAEAADPAGMIKVVKGSVSILRGDAVIEATPGAQVFPQDRLRTGADGSVGITLKDDTLISSGPNSTVAIDKYAFDATTHVGEMLISVLKGTFSMVSGMLVKHSPEAAAVKTPTATIGVRGTEFAIEVD